MPCCCCVILEAANGLGLGLGLGLGIGLRLGIGPARGLRPERALPLPGEALPRPPMHLPALRQMNLQTRSCGRNTKPGSRCGQQLKQLWIYNELYPLRRGSCAAPYPSVQQAAPSCSSLRLLASWSFVVQASVDATRTQRMQDSLDCCGLHIVKGYAIPVN